jgi:hypothetical protein
MLLITNTLPVTTAMNSLAEDLIIGRCRKICGNAEKYYQLAGHIAGYISKWLAILLGAHIAKWLDILVGSHIAKWPAILLGAHIAKW